MNRRETAEEPSMEDILASIRKIIADEPAVAAAPPLPLPKLSPVGFFPATAKEPQPSLTAPKPSLTARLNDVFGPGSIVPGDRQDNQHALKPLPATRPIRSVMDDDLGDLLADTPPPSPPKPATAARPAPTVIAQPPARSRPFPLDNAAADLLSGRATNATPQGAPASDTARASMPPQSAQFPPNARLTELRPTPQTQATALFDTSPSFSPQSASEPAPQSRPEANRPAPVVIAAMAPMEYRPLPAARPFSFAPAAPVAAPAPLTTSPAAPKPLAARPEPTVLAPSETVSFSPAPLPQASTAAPTPVAQPSVGATIPPLVWEAPVREAQTTSADISTSTLDFLLPTSRPADTAPLASAPAQLDSLPVAPIIVASNLDFLKPAPQTIESKPAEALVERLPVAVVQPAPQTAAPAPAPAAVAAAPSQPPPAALDTVTAASKVLASQSSPAAPIVAAPANALSETVDPSVAVASALGALAAGLAASSREPVPEIIVSAIEVSPPQVTLSNVSTTEADASPQDKPGATTSAATSTGVSVFSSPVTFAGGSELKPISTSTLDDTAAELLRPMLRQWLDDNMPRIVERALRIELTDAVTVAAKSDGGK